MRNNCNPSKLHIGKTTCIRIRCSLMGCHTWGTKNLPHDFSLSSEQYMKGEWKKEQKPWTKSTVLPSITQVEIERFIRYFYEGKYNSLNFLWLMNKYLGFYMTYFHKIPWFPFSLVFPWPWQPWAWNHFHQLMGEQQTFFLGLSFFFLVAVSV